MEKRKAESEPAGESLEERLWEAVDHGEEEQVLRLLEQGASPDAASPDGMPCAFAPAARGDEGILRALLAAGWDPLRTNKGSSALTLAIKHGGAGVTRVALDAVGDPKIALETAFESMDGNLKKRRHAAGFLFESALEVARWAEERGAESDWARWSGIREAAREWGAMFATSRSLGLMDGEEALELNRMIASLEERSSLGASLPESEGECRGKREIL